MPDLFSPTGGAFSDSAGPAMDTKTTQFTYDPTQQFIYNYLRSQLGAGQGAVSPDVTAGISRMINNPGAVGDIAGQQFQDISQPLIQAQQGLYKQEQNSLRDILRKNGALQSGASAYETSRLLENQGNRTSQMLAANYIPLTKQISNNVLGGIDAGVRVPQSNLGSLAAILGSMKPTSTTETSPYRPSGGGFAGIYGSGSISDPGWAFTDPSNPNYRTPFSPDTGGAWSGPNSDKPVQYNPYYTP